jgi:biopolymer transport protein ExbB
VVAAGVAEALLTTGAGLIVAVPAVMLYNHFARRVQVMLGVAENQARVVRLAIEEKGIAVVPGGAEADAAPALADHEAFPEPAARAA